jgi:prepilin-type processing-associated H-X9-DG protein
LTDGPDPRELARLRVEARGDALGFLYVDGHVRVYHGKHRLPKLRPVFKGLITTKPSPTGREWMAVLPGVKDSQAADHEAEEGMEIYFKAGRCP